MCCEIETTAAAMFTRMLGLLHLAGFDSTGGPRAGYVDDG